MQLQQALVELEHCLADFNVERMRTAKEVYYNVVFEGCRNAEIKRALEKVIDRIYFLRSQLLLDEQRRESSLREIRRLTDALAARDRLAARSACLLHLDAARDAVLAQMSKQSDDSSQLKMKQALK